MLERTLFSVEVQDVSRTLAPTTLEVKSLLAEDHAREFVQGMVLRINWSSLMLSPSIY
jgi:hypothetical protein